MTVGNFSECLLNDSNSALGVSNTFISSNINSSLGGSISSSSSSTSIVSQCIEDILDKAEPIVLNTLPSTITMPVSDSILPSIKSSTTTFTPTTPLIQSNTSNNAISHNNNSVHSLGQLKKMKSTLKKGRNHAGAKYLASQYTSMKRFQEYVGISLCLPLIVYNFISFILHFDINKWYVIIFAAVIGILTADLISGIVHWAADSYGSVEMFLVGKNLLRNFREHHIDPTAITRHDFVETNGDNLTAIVPILGYLAYKFSNSDNEEIISQYNWHLYLFFIAVFLSLTNQFHKWSHTYFGLPRYITILQDLHIILPRIHHRVHHVTPHDTYFCITTGWLNYPLDLINFWQRLENTVYMLTGSKPRMDDMKWALKTE